MGVREELAEARERATDAAAQERAGAVAHDVGVQSPGFILVPAGMHPEHGEPVTFQPGELLPAWAVEAFTSQRPEPDQHQVYRLSPPAGRRKPRRETT